MRKFFIVFFLFLFFSCKNVKKNKIDVSNISVNVDIERFEIDFYNCTKEKLPKLKSKYLMLFPHNIDSIWINKINNKDEKELFLETQKVFKDFSNIKKQLENLFKHIKYYNHQFIVPKVITMITNMDDRVIFTKKNLFISLDNFLGANHKFYSDYPLYIKQNNRKEQIIVEVAKQYIESEFPPNIKRRFIDKIIFEGKKMYFLDAYLPNVSDKDKIGYSDKKNKWAKLSEENVWRYFIDNNLLYSSESKLNKRFIDLAPFSKFYLSEDNMSPGRIGVYIGWHIVRSFMENNDVSLQDLINLSEQEIFKKSKYKPLTQWQ